MIHYIQIFLDSTALLNLSKEKKITFFLNNADHEQSFLEKKIRLCVQNNQFKWKFKFNAYKIHTDLQTKRKQYEIFRLLHSYKSFINHAEAQAVLRKQFLPEFKHSLWLLSTWDRILVIELLAFTVQIALFTLVIQNHFK